MGVGQDGSIYVADTVNNRIQKFTNIGVFLSKWGTFGTGEGQFDNPWGIAVMPGGFVYVADLFNYRIQKFGPAGVPVFPITWGRVKADRR